VSVGNTGLLSSVGNKSFLLSNEYSTAKPAAVDQRGDNILLSLSCKWDRLLCMLSSSGLWIVLDPAEKDFVNVCGSH